MEISSRQVRYEIECGSDEPAVLKHIEEVSMCEYTITFSSKYGCPVGSHRGRGWRFVTMVLSIVMFYLVIGGSINYHKYGMRGVDVIPQLEYWRQVPGLVKDGVTFSAGMAKDGYNYGNEKLLKGKLPAL